MCICVCVRIRMETNLCRYNGMYSSLWNWTSVSLSSSFQCLIWFFFSFFMLLDSKYLRTFIGRDLDWNMNWTDRNNVSILYANSIFNLVISYDQILSIHSIYGCKRSIDEIVYLHIRFIPKEWFKNTGIDNSFYFISNIPLDRLMRHAKWWIISENKNSTRSKNKNIWYSQ